MRSHMPKNGGIYRSQKKANLFQVSNERLDRIKPIQGSDSSSPRINQACFALKEKLWNDLVRGKLVVIPRENRSLYREGLRLEREGDAKIELQTEETLYLYRSDDLIKRPEPALRARKARFLGINPDVKQLKQQQTENKTDSRST